jgi:3',5'-cyclic AMP phosphodiesterase CpdA
MLLDSARIPGIAALILCGDNTTGNQEDYDNLKSILDVTDSVNYFLTTGNHDLYHAGWATYFPYFGASSYTLEIRTPSTADLIIVIDNSSGTLGSKQFDWLKSILVEKRPSYRHCIVAGHVNFYRNRFTVSTNPLTEEIWALIDLFAEHRVDLLVSGHDHERYIETFGNTTYLTMDAVKDGEANASWMKLHVSDSLDYSFVSFSQ